MNTEQLITALKNGLVIHKGKEDKLYAFHSGPNYNIEIKGWGSALLDEKDILKSIYFFPEEWTIGQPISEEEWRNRHK